MKGLEIYKGLKTKIMTDLKVEVNLTIDKIEKMYEDEEQFYSVKFTNGAQKRIDNLDELDITLGDKIIDLTRYETVNKCETIQELAQAIMSFANEEGMIQGKSREFNASKMADACLTINQHQQWNTVTRNWGIRQQLIMLT